MKAICIILILTSLFFIYVSIKGLREEAEVINHCYRRQQLGFNSDNELKEAKFSVNMYILFLVFMGLVDIICINAFLS